MARSLAILLLDAKLLARSIHPALLAILLDAELLARSIHPALLCILLLARSHVVDQLGAVQQSCCCWPASMLAILLDAELLLDVELLLDAGHPAASCWPGRCCCCCWPASSTATLDRLGEARCDDSVDVVHW